MSLTYQPFAEIPEIKKLAHELQMNMPDNERALSAIAGAGLFVLGLGEGRSGVARWLLLGLGAALVHRGVSGQCALYRQLQVDRRHPAEGAPQHHGTKVEESIEIHRTPEELYEFWRDLEQLPRVMRHVESVRVLEEYSHWKIKAVAGFAAIEWDAEIINEEPGRMIAWRSLPDSRVRNAGSVWFEPAPSGATRLKVAFEYDLPGGALGTALAKMLGSDPRKLLREDLAAFKEHAEREMSPQGTVQLAG